MIGKVVYHYKILEKLVEGGTGVVFKALDEMLNRIVALKFFHGQPFANEDHKAFITKEAQAANDIIHRNLNSANILIEDRGLAKILNFGLPAPSSGTAPTVSGEFANTAAYLSLELLRNEAVDQRTDIWSWGVVLYEMLTGKLPFEGEPPGVLIDAIQNDAPQLPSDLNTKVPAELDRIITRALAKPLPDRYQSFSEIIVDLQALGAAKQEPGQDVDIAGQPAPSIAVLAFEDLSPAKDQEYFCDGIAEEIINDLAKVGGLQVASRTSSFAYKGAREDIRNINQRP